MQLEKEYAPVIKWLYLICLMVFAMVFIGGVTRLTDSGLSMVDWKPIMGAIPPLTESEWLSAFEKYKAYPEFNLVNSQMDLSGFKSIFFWEYFHRLFGRLIGLIFLFPYLFFLFRKRIPKAQNKNLIFLFMLGGMQGLLGWYMVKSGLVNRPDVSQYRLAAHLGLAFFIIAYAMWTILAIKYPARRFIKATFKENKFIVLFSLVLMLQIFYGALVAGLDAGLTHNTFPKMGRFWIPTDISWSGLWSLKSFEHVVYVQFIHRCIGWFLVGLGAVMLFRFKTAKHFLVKRSMQYVVMMLGLQFLLGALTIVLNVPISVASMHQIGACALILLNVRLLFFSFTRSLK